MQVSVGGDITSLFDTAAVYFLVVTYIFFFTYKYHHAIVDKNPED